MELKRLEKLLNEEFKGECKIIKKHYKHKIKVDECFGGVYMPYEVEIDKDVYVIQRVKDNAFYEVTFKSLEELKEYFNFA